MKSFLRAIAVVYFLFPLVLLYPMEVVWPQMVAISTIQKAHVIATVLEIVHQLMDLLISPEPRFFVGKNQKTKACLAMS